MLRNINNERNVIIESIISICLAGIAGTTYMYKKIIANQTIMYYKQ